MAWFVAPASMATLKYPITIAGGGLAGLSLGIALRHHGVDVTLHEASTYPRHRVCGEFISGVAEDTLSRLGIAHSLADAIPLITACWSDASGLLGSMKVAGRGISRWELDQNLQRTFTDLGGRLVTQSRVEPAPGIIWAAGRPKRPGTWLGLKFHARNLDLTHDLEMHMGATGYLGLARIEKGLVNVCGLFHSHSKTKAKGPALLIAHLRAGGLQKLADRLESADIDASSFCGVAGFCLGSQPGPPFSIGDSACMIPPFTGNGMSMAFESAECALQPALDYAGGHQTWDQAAAASQKAHHQRFRRRLTIAGFLHSLLTTRLGMRITTSLARHRAVPYGLLLQLVR